MKTGVAMLCLGTLILAETVTLDPIDIYEPAMSAGSYIVNEEEAAQTGNVTLQERLKRDVAFSVVPDIKGEGAVSFRGLDFKVTGYVEDGIPLYRSVNGLVDTKFHMSDAQLRMNDGSGASSFGVSPMNEMFTFFPWEPANPGLELERSMQYAVGYQQEADETSLVDLSLYYYDIRDLIIYRNSGYINRDEAKSYGAELRMESERYRHHYLRFSYAYAHTRDSEDEVLELIPEHRVKLEDTLMFTRAWKGYFGYQYVGSRYSSNTATYTDEQKKLSAYHLVDLQVSYEGIKQTALRVGIKNLLDETYAWQYGYPSEGRLFYLSLEWQL